MKAKILYEVILNDWFDGKFNFDFFIEINNVIMTPWSEIYLLTTL